MYRGLAAAFFTCLTAVCGAQTDDRPRWEQAYHQDEITVWIRTVTGSALHEIRASVAIAAPTEQVWKVLNDTARFPEFMPYVVEARVIGSTPQGHVEYQRIDPPFVGQRDYVVEVTTWRDPADGTLHRRWTATDGAGPAPVDGVVRIDTNKGEWTVSAVGGARSVATYYLFTDPGGAIPSWIANRANRSTIPRLMKAVRDRAMQAGNDGAP